MCVVRSSFSLSLLKPLPDFRLFLFSPLFMELLSMVVLRAQRQGRFDRRQWRERGFLTLPFKTEG